MLQGDFLLHANHLECVLQLVNIIDNHSNILATVNKVSFTSTIERQTKFLPPLNKR